MTEEHQTVAGAYAEIRGHEKLCAERYRGINEKLAWLIGGVCAMALGLMSWSWVQLYTLEPLRVQAAAAQMAAAQRAASPTFVTGAAPVVQSGR